MTRSALRWLGKRGSPEASLSRSGTKPTAKPRPPSDPLHPSLPLHVATSDPDRGLQDLADGAASSAAYAELHGVLERVLRYSLPAKGSAMEQGNSLREGI